MGLTVVLEDEKQAVISSTEVELTDLLFDQLDKDSFKLIKYLDKYGDTVFNHLQIADLVSDLEKIQQIKYNSKITLIIELARKCEQEQHTSLTFYGD